jgi:hypothetical protein
MATVNLHSAALRAANGRAYVLSAAINQGRGVVAEKRLTADHCTLK